MGGGSGSDEANYTSATAGITANLTVGTATGQGSDTLTEIERLRGSPFPDSLRTGDDSLYGWAGRDDLFGEADDDYLNGGANNDSCDGGSGTDTLVDC